MKRRLLFITALSAIAFLAGCASVQRQTVATPPSSKTLTANGYARFDDSGTVQVKQRWLSTQQQAKLNAFRGLADQLYYEPVGGGKTVGSQVVSHEAYRIYLDGYLREAKASDYRTVKDTLKTTMTLSLTPMFYQCMAGDLAQINGCLRDEDKLDFTRLGFKSAQTSSVNLACGNRDCSDEFYVQGFSKDISKFNGALLDAGLYHSRWIVNTGSRTLFNFLLLDGIVNAL